ncbi:putative tetratricopeptide-like helical domain superfamily [Helianthus annuus]|uniref:Tetratricopeptide-like helical domain superfamily n=2 Tax=Helianthus annuus TaxID=4232 RepID=A0A9K3MXI5_HELAN|nr:pentatricopeptide repeat-containing protein At3g50420 [Helianthus annuus]KAF5779375.1 putative tetratricopeptide-like helical domain superfamily [Helianthus annuus]KAJ0490645.1 putative tetratricopeptide-like helical domain superfamily [Helianthus annuus]KAJ0494924.1 putative tetratricopeptide-like helical domain superfamily [Helianthus annuus]KAJ0506564.1 putative tetratricopeptide-like helical domain superfamily [Helianthus annuus]KAJ0676240.1 putative tetratricopeptide-like helical domai
MSSSQEAIALATVFIKKCSSVKTLKKARQIHAQVITSIPAGGRSPYLNNNILSMYSRCGSVLEAHQVFDEMPQRSIVSYNALIAAYSHSSNAYMVFELLTRMSREGFTPNGPTFTSLLQASCCFGDATLGSALHAQIVKLDFMSDTLVQTSLLGMYSDFGDLESSKNVFSSMVWKDAMAWNSIIVGHMKNDKIMQGLCFYGGMVKAGALPTPFTYSMVLTACSKLHQHDVGQVTHARLIVSGTPTDLPLQNALLNMYSSCGDTEMEIKVFKQIKNPDLVSWNSMLSALAGKKDAEKCVEMFIHLRKVSLIKPDHYTFAIVISATRSLPACSYGRPLHCQVIKSGFDVSVYVGSTLVSMYFENRDCESAQKLLTLIASKDVVFWTEMITGYARMGDGENAIRCFREMSQEHKIDSFAVSIALSACADLTASKQGDMIHCQAVKRGYDLEMNVCGSLIDMYAKSGDLKSAELILSNVKTPDLKCWNSMLLAYGHHGKAESAFRIFDEIVKHGLIPDDVTYLSMLATCNHCGLVDKGKFIWSSMKQKGLVPGSKHYSCLVNLLSRAGLLTEAEATIMDLDSTSRTFSFEVWRTLLSSCVDRRNLEVGNRVAERIVNANKEDSAGYVLLTNLYALMDRWDDVSKMRRKIRGLVGEKDAGLSWIELVSGAHVFSSGDKTHPEVDELQTELLSLQQNLMKPEEEDSF